MRSLRVLLLVALAVAGCHRRPGPPPARVAYSEALFGAKRTPVFTLMVDGQGRPLDTVVGEPRRYVIQDGDTLMDIARLYDLGYNEIVEANPGVDPWVPAVGRTIVLPTQWVLPCCRYEGLVVNIPEMRLFYYQPTGADRVVLRTYPVGLGRSDRRTPRGRFTIVGRTVNPTWVIPESIRREHERERGDARRIIAGGASDNPLGKYRLELSIAPYAIHGTDIPWGVGMEVSHGCARLYPEDIARLFPLVAKGTPGEFVYQPIKVGRRGGAVFVEAHPDLYKLTGPSAHVLAGALGRAGVRAQPSDADVVVALQASHGMPYRFGARRTALTAP